MEDPVERHLRERREGELDERLASTHRDLDRSLSGEGLMAKYGFGTSSSVDTQDCIEIEALVVRLLVLDIWIIRSCVFFLVILKVHVKRVHDDCER